MKFTILANSKFSFKAEEKVSEINEIKTTIVVKRLKHEEFILSDFRERNLFSTGIDEIRCKGSSALILCFSRDLNK